MMPSPFPGMDPYLENPGLWPDVHHALISEIQATLNNQLRPKYFARVEERVYISDENDPGRSVIIPDVRVVEGGRGKVGVSPSSRSATAVAEPEIEEARPIEVTTLIDDEIHEARLEVIDRAERSVVTVIEILSPTNKVTDSTGRKSYIDKRRDVMHSPGHLVEIDLLRAGTPIHARELYPRCHYLVHVSKRMNEQRRRAWVWPIRLQQRLPHIAIPLRGDDPDAKLDLQSILNTAYERGAYDLDIDYQRDPIPPLDPELATWAKQVIDGAQSQAKS